MSFETPLPPYNASDPHATFLNSACLDFLLIEMVPVAYRIDSQLEISEEEEGGGRIGGGKLLVDDEDEEHKREAAFRRLETLGYRVGQGLVER